MSTDVPVLVPTYTDDRPRLDGKISERVWSGAEAAGQFELVGSEGKATQKSEVRVCYDRAALHVRFECFEDSMDSVVTKFAGDQELVWQDDSVEVWISPFSVAGKWKSHRFVVNAAGAKAHFRPDHTGHVADWRAAATRLADRWISEISIPYQAIRPLGRNEDCWRINFCRNERPHGEMSSWSAVPEFFATHSRFGRLVPPEEAFRFNTFRGAPKPFAAPRSPKAGVREVSGPVKEMSSDLVIIPQPQELHRRSGKGSFRIGPNTRIVIDSDAIVADMQSVDELRAAIERMGGFRLETVPVDALPNDPSRISDVIMIGEPSRASLLHSMCQFWEIRMPRSRFNTGAYVVDVTPERICLCGQSPTDTYYAVQTFKQVLRLAEDGSVHVPAIAIRDFPRFTFRGVHLLASRDALPFLGRMIENVLAPLKISQIVLQTDKVAWKSHPEVVDPDNSMSREDVRELVEIARRRHIAVTPLVPSLGHLEWAFRGGSNLAFAEDPENPYCYCMSNPDSHKFIFDIMDEAIELFGQPEYLHAGRDEFDMVGEMPADESCKAVGKERLYVRDTLNIRDHLRSKGCKMMMWGDVLTRPGFRDLVGELPKDILIADWRYAPSESYPSVDFYLSRAFPVVGCTWYDPRNVFTLSRYAAARGTMGMLQTTWTGFAPEEVVMERWPEQVYAYVLSAAWAWNPMAPEIGKLPYRPDTVFTELWSEETRRAPSKHVTVELGRYCNISRADSGRVMGWLGIGRGNDLRGIPDGLVSIHGLPYKIVKGAIGEPSAIMLAGDGMTEAFPRRVDGIEIGARVIALDFLHGCAFCADEGTRVGAYIVRYEDGESREIPLLCGRNIYVWDDQILGPAYGFVWKGRSQDGRVVGVSGLRWVNERPEVSIRSVDFVAADTDASPFLLALTGEV